MVKNLPANTGDVRDVDLIPELGSLNLTPEMAIHSSMLGEFHGQRSLVSYSSKGHWMERIRCMGERLSGKYQHLGASLVAQW